MTRDGFPDFETSLTQLTSKQRTQGGAEGVKQLNLLFLQTGYLENSSQWTHSFTGYLWRVQQQMMSKRKKYILEAYF